LACPLEPAVLYRFGRDPNCGRPTSTEWERTGALASEGVVEGAVEEAGVRMVRCGATPCRAHRILCLCPEQEPCKALPTAPSTDCIVRRLPSWSRLFNCIVRDMEMNSISMSEHH
jgi:hypothetical protein